MDFQSQETIVTIKAENEYMEMNEEVDEETKGPVRSETQAIQTVFDSNQHLKADVWKEFVSVGVGEDGKKRGRCIHCSRNFIIERLYGTSHLRRHLLSCTKKPENKSGGSDEQVRHKRYSTDVKGASVSESSCDREEVNNNVSKKRQRSSTSKGKTRSAMLLGLDILDCPICFDTLTIPIFQCDNGHLACSSCCSKLSNKCPTCDSPVGQNRCREMEQLDFGSQETIATIKAENECMEMNEEVDEETKGPVRSETQAIQTVFDSNQRLKADVWKEFVSVGVGEDGKKRGCCIHCSRNFIIERLHGTSHLRRHLLSCPKKPENKNGGNDEQDRHKHNSTDVTGGASVSESSCDKEEVSNNVSKKRQHSSTSEGKTRSAMLLGLDILDCPICFDALTIPIFQCDHGHLACSSCCPKLSNKCPTCDSPVGHNRCRAMESILESVFVPCRNAKFGCTKNVSYGKESTHEKECSFSQCACPALDCNYTGSYNDIYTHFVDNHCHESKSMSFVCGGSVDVQMNIATDKILVLWESKKRLLLTLQCFNEPHGLYVTVRCIAPSAPELGKLAYCLYYSMDGHTLTYKSPEVKMVLELSSETPQDNFMFVPRSLLRGESLKMKISIGLEDED